MELLVVFGTALLIGFSGAIVPGPLLSVTINESLRRGAVGGLLVVCGHGLLEMLLVIGIASGFNKILALKTVGSVIGVSGGLVLLWFGYSIICNISREIDVFKDEEGKTKGKKEGWHAPVIAGIVTSISNPFWFLWWAAVGTALIVQALSQGTAGLIAFYSGHILADFIWYMFVTIMVVYSKRFLNEKTYKIILIACGIFLICFGIYFILSGFGLVGGIGDLIK